MSHPFNRDRFPAPSAPWVDEDELVYSHELREAAEILKVSLAKRISKLDSPDLALEVLLDEIRMQIATCAVEGSVMVASDLADLAVSLVTARESRNRSL